MTNPLGVHALVFAGGTTPAEMTSIIAETKKAGYDILELSLHDSPALDVAAARAELEEAGLGIVCSRGLAFDADVSSDDAAVVARGAALLHDSLQITHDLGGSHFTGALYSALGKYGHPLSSAGRANVVSTLTDLAAEAAAKNMTLGLEVCNRYETNVINTAADALRLADDIGADNVVIQLPHEHRGRRFFPPGAARRRPSRLRAHRREPSWLPRQRTPRLHLVLPRPAGHRVRGPDHL